MDTLKTAVVVVLLLAVLYGVYTVLNKPAVAPPEPSWIEPQALGPLQVDFGESVRVAAPSSGGTKSESRSSADALAASLPAARVAGNPPSVGGPAVPSIPSTTPSVTPPSLLSESSSTETAASSGTAPAGVATQASAQFVTEARQEPRPPRDSAWAPPVEKAVRDAGANTTEAFSGSSTATVDAAASPGSVPTPSQLVESTGTSTSSNSNLAQGLSSPSQPSAKADVAASGESRTVTDVSTSGTTDGSAIGTSKSEEAIQSAHARIEEGKWYEALFNLSLQYGSGELTEEERRRLGDLLDPLAGKVVYSKEHLIEPAYEVRRGETLMDIAERHNVPWQLLANINEVKDPQVLLPGTKLKVVPGPFRAEVDLARRELVLFAGRLYAGRFPITVGSNPAPKPGEYRVNDKQAGRTFYAGGGQTIPAGDPANPYGQIWIDLGGDVCIHGSPEKVQGGMGCISLSPTDANDVYGILSRGSGVVVRR